MSLTMSNVGLMKGLQKGIIFLSIVVSFFIGLWLLYTVFQSGYGYQFDVDELHHANLAYLYLHGAIPYKDVYDSFYTPVFTWYIMPVFALFGFSFATITFARFTIIILLIIRMIAAWFLIKHIFSKRAAWIFIPLFILDPFLVYSGMQIRPDNLMMTFFTVALAFFSYGLTKQSSRILSVAAFFFGLAFLTLIKVIPGIAVVLLIFLGYCITQKKLTLIPQMALAFMAPIFAFLFYGLFTGALYEIWMQLVVEAGIAYSIIRFPVHVGFFHQPNNIFIYGTMGAPITLSYAWVLPILGGAGAYLVLTKSVSKQQNPQLRSLHLILFFLFVAQWIVLLKVPSAYLQHYLPLNWLSALFGAVVIDDLLSKIQYNKVLYTVCSMLLVVCFYAIARPSMTYNYARSTIKGVETIARYESLWKKLPENEPIFPGLLFRPMAYPVPFGYYIGNVPEYTLNRLPDIPTMIEEKKLQHLAFDDYTLSLMPQRVQSYVTANYTRVPGDPDLMVRK